MNKICNLERHYLLSVDPIEFISCLECAYIFNNWIENDIYLHCNFGTDVIDINDTSKAYNNIAIIGIYNIVSNLTSIFFYELLSGKHKNEFSNIKKPFELSNTFSINIKCDESFIPLDDNITHFIYDFNGTNILVQDCINTKTLGVYEHSIFIPNTNANDFLRSCLFLYESFVESIVDKIEYF